MRKIAGLFAIAAVWLGSAAWLSAQEQAAQKQSPLEREMAETAQKQLDFAKELAAQQPSSADTKPLKATTPNLFSLYQQELSHPFEFGKGSEISLDAESYAWGLRKVYGGWWSRSDEHGTVNIHANVHEKTANFSVDYSPHVPEPVGDAVLAALITKAEDIKFGTTADEIKIRLARYDLSDGPHTGTRDEWWTFHLAGALLEETEAVFEWK